ncbi:hypothetical protein [uncultured Bartonella sp.]|uniref:hypothetical protein n=1 Tax=uncultured Bartonella sp. TaxID=104108 RepID=UPI002637BD4B|nr:hypothetical protein [uncultured Bartonella sp.]
MENISDNRLIIRLKRAKSHDLSFKLLSHNCRNFIDVIDDDRQAKICTILPDIAMLEDILTGNYRKKHSIFYWHKFVVGRLTHAYYQILVIIVWLVWHRQY